MTEVNVSNSVTSIGNGKFNDCSDLTSIEVAADNTEYTYEDGVLFNKYKTSLIQYPRGKQGTYTISESVTSIEDYAFHGCEGLTSVTIPNSVTRIGGYVFADCNKLERVDFFGRDISIAFLAFGFYPIHKKHPSLKFYSYADNKAVKDYANEHGIPFIPFENCEG